MAGVKVTDPALLAQLEGGAPAQPQAPQAPQQEYRGSILPFSRDEKGLHWAVPGMVQGLFNAAKSTATLPGDVYAGRTDPKSAEGFERTLEAATMLTPMGTASRAGERAIAGEAKNLRQRVPSTKELYDAGGEGFNAARAKGQDFKSSAVSQSAAETKAALDSEGFIDVNAERTHKIIQQLTSPPADSVSSFDNIEAARRAASKLSVNRNADDADRVAAGRLVRALDGFIEGEAPPFSESLVSRSPSSVQAAGEAGKLQKDARGNWAAASRSDMLEGVGEHAELRAKVANSGLNHDNTVRQRIVAELFKGGEDPAGFIKSEVDAIKGAATGGPARNAMRRVGNALGGGGGVGAAMLGLGGAAAGGASGNPGMAVAGAALPLVGYTARRVANALADRSLDKAGELVRKRSPLAEKQPYSELTHNEMNMALIRALMAEEQGRR